MADNLFYVIATWLLCKQMSYGWLSLEWEALTQEMMVRHFRKNRLQM